MRTFFEVQESGHSDSAFGGGTPIVVDHRGLA